MFTQGIIQEFCWTVSQIWNLGIVTMLTYSVALAVMISILRWDLVGSQPMLSAVSLGILVMLAPVSSTKFSKTGFPLGPLMRPVTGMKLSFGSIKYLGMSRESGDVTFGKFVSRKGHEYGVFSIGLGDLFVDQVAVRAMFNKPPPDGRRIFDLIDADQQPFIL